MQNTQEDFYFNLVLFMLPSQLYFYVLGPCSLLGYQYFNIENNVIFVIRQLRFPAPIRIRVQSYLQIIVSLLEIVENLDE